MYKLYLKSTRNPIELSDELGLKMKVFFEDPTIADEEKITTTFWSGTKSSIRDIVKEKNESQNVSAEKTSSEMRTKDMSWRKERQQFQGMPVEEKANELSFFFMVCQSFMKAGQDTIPKEVVTEAIEIQSQFFAENPYRCVCDLRPLSVLFPKGVQIDMILGDVIKSTIRKDREYAKAEETYNSHYEIISNEKRN